MRVAQRIRAVFVVFCGGATIVAVAGCSSSANMDKLIATSVDDSKRMLSMVVDTMTDQHAAPLPPSRCRLRSYQ